MNDTIRKLKRAKHLGKQEGIKLAFDMFEKVLNETDGIGPTLSKRVKENVLKQLIEGEG